MLSQLGLVTLNLRSMFLLVIAHLFQIMGHYQHCLWAQLITNFITISSTIFLNNRGSNVTLDTEGVNLNIHGSSFVNNTALNGGAISIILS